MNLRTHFTSALLAAAVFGLAPVQAQQPQPVAAKTSAPVSAPGRDGYSRVMDSKICTTAPRTDWLPEDEMKLLAEHRGYRIKTFRVDKNNCYEIYGFNRENQIVEAYFDPVTSRLLHQNIAK